MQTKPLLYGLIGFFIGGLLVSVAATTFDRPPEQQNTSALHGSMSASNLTTKSRDDFDAAFMSEMITHHEGAVEMAKMSAANAKHDEIKQLSKEIISAQQKEIRQLKQWQKDWGYSAGSAKHNNASH
ncbi:MAG TPA: DUF305 domain-containing protein [Candidatus Saccharimonadales bacterium]|jgi:uncharacterized protein (DUF305 family)